MMILIAVGSGAVRSQIVHLCEREGLHAISAESVQQTCAALSQQPIAAVVLDEWFRDGTASDLIRAVRHIQGEQVAIVSIAVQVRAFEDPAFQPDACVLKANLVRDLVHEVRTQVRNKEALPTVSEAPAHPESSTPAASSLASLPQLPDENRGQREHMLRLELETNVQRTLAEARSRHADEMRVAYSLAERKADEAERARLELEQITEGIPQIVWTSAADGGEPRFNRHWTDYTGLPNQGVTNAVWRRTIYRDDLPRALREWVKSFRASLPYASECRLRSASGEFRWFVVRAIPLNDTHGKIDRWFGTCTDVHDQKLGEEALRRTEKLAATGRLVASIAHEINNPLESVTNLLYLIEQNTRSDPETHEFVTTAQKELDRVAHISKKTLAFYRESTTAAPVDLSALIHEVAEIYGVRLGRKNISLNLELTCERRPHGLAGELRQVISNLVTNAIDASPTNCVIRVRVRESRAWDSSAAEGVRVSVADQGHGIPVHLRPEIFKPFITTKGQLGTGLGLWVSHSIIQRHGGHLLLRSSTGQNHGTCFSVFLPAKLRAKPSEADSVGSMLGTVGKELLG